MQTANVKVVQVCAQFDQADELAVRDASRPNARGRPPVQVWFIIDRLGNPGTVGAQSDTIPGHAVRGSADRILHTVVC
jgi:hypothetical protein